jgi:hypothetical protein
MTDNFSERVITITSSGRNAKDWIDAAISVVQGAYRLEMRRTGDNTAEVTCSTMEQAHPLMYTLMALDLTEIKIAKAPRRRIRTRRTPNENGAK